MNNTEKLLRAFIEAQGYGIERVRTGDAHCDCFKGNPLSQDYMTGCMKCQGTGVVHGIYDYKVTKKAVNTSMAEARFKANVDRGTFR